MNVADLLATHEGDEPALPGRPTRMYRAIAVLAGLILLCGAVTASTAALSGPRAERAVPSSTIGNSITAITGANVLHPDLINTSVGVPPQDAAPPPADDGDQNPSRGGGVPNLPDPDGTARPLPQYDQATPDAGPATPEGSDPPPTSAAEPLDDSDEDSSRDVLNSALGPILGTVTMFYQTAPIAPRQAFDLLDPQMQGTGYDEFRQAWVGVRKAIVEDIRQDGPRAALVIVRLERDDGTMLRTLQRVLVTPGAQPQIADAQLLSASRS